MRVAILGDIHGDTEYLDYALTQAKSLGAEIMIQVGDFGFGFSEKFLQNLEAVLNVHQLPLYAIRGNHDDPWWWSSYRRMGNLHLIPDGFVTTIGKKRRCENDYQTQKIGRSTPTEFKGPHWRWSRL